MGEVLASIESENLLPPLLVVQILSANKNITLSVVKDFIHRRLHQEAVVIAEDERQIRMYKEESARMRREITELQTSAKIFQLSKCVKCHNPLELPTVHFLCMHSF